jgi:magnesium chelatase family protein
VVGQPLGRHVLEVAAAGGHHLLLTGPPGAGKTMLAERLPGLLPELSPDAALETTAVHSVAGLLEPGAPLVTRPPYQDPHHSASRAAIVGGGSGYPRPGALSLAHNGVLFLDEAPEFATDVLEALRQPLESGEVVIARAAATARYPARFQLVLAANPCPCGLASGRGEQCRCSPAAKRRYGSRLSGPLLDRVDLRVDLPPVSRAELADDRGGGEPTAAVAARVAEARLRMQRRLADVPSGTGRWRCNGEVPGYVLRRHWPVPPSAAAPAHALLASGRLTARGVDRVLRVAWTLADLAGRPTPTAEHVLAAATLRSVQGAVA